MEPPADGGHEQLIIDDEGAKCPDVDEGGAEASSKSDPGHARDKGQGDGANASKASENEIDKDSPGPEEISGLQEAPLDLSHEVPAKAAECDEDEAIGEDCLRPKEIYGLQKAPPDVGFKVPTKAKEAESDEEEGDCNSTMTKDPGSPLLNAGNLPREMWWEVCNYLDHGSLKSLRATHPLIYQAVNGYKRFCDSSIVNMKFQTPSIFDKLAHEKYAWKKLGIEVVNGKFDRPIGKKFYEKYESRLTSLAFLNCQFSDKIPEFSILAIIDKSPNLVSLEIGGLSNILSKESDSNSLRPKWKSIKKVTIRKGKLLDLDSSLLKNVLSRTVRLEELSVLASNTDLPGTRRLFNLVTPLQKKIWTDDAKWVMKNVVPHIEKLRLTIKKLDFSNHVYLASTTNFVDEIVRIFYRDESHFDFVEEYNGELIPVPDPKLEELKLTMCQLNPAQLSELGKLAYIDKITCCLIPPKKCRHPKEKSENEAAETLSKAKDSKHIIQGPILRNDKGTNYNGQNKQPLYQQQELKASRVLHIRDLNISNSVSLDCVCFIGQMKNLLHLDLSYCVNIRPRPTFLNGTGPTFGPYSKTGENKFREKGPQKIIPWKLQTFKFAGNGNAKLNIKKYAFYSLVHLDLSFSNCIQTTKDFIHICLFRKLEVLKLSGSTGKFTLTRLKKLQRLRELRLRSCTDIEPIEFEKNIKLPLLRTLDIADTLVTFSGMMSILNKNRLLETLDVRKCVNIDVVANIDFFGSTHHVTIRSGYLPPKLRRAKKGENPIAAHETGTSSIVATVSENKNFRKIESAEERDSFRDALETVISEGSGNTQEIDNSKIKNEDLKDFQELSSEEKIMRAALLKFASSDFESKQDPQNGSSVTLTSEKPGSLIDGQESISLESSDDSKLDPIRNNKVLGPEVPILSCAAEKLEPENVLEDISSEEPNSVL